MSGRSQITGNKRELTGYDNPTLSLSVEGIYTTSGVNRTGNGSNGHGPIPENDRKQRLSFSTLTQEALPRIDSYSNTNNFFAKRPSISDFHDEPRFKTDKDETENVKQISNDSAGHGIKLGWIQGVLIPCLLNIWGVMLFLRLAWVVGESGIVYSLIIITISAVVCVITTLSLSAISTNGEVKGGGVYYIISRSLGPEFGASVGLILAFANAVAASMNTIGFCDSLNELLKEYNLKIIDGGVNDVRIVGVVAIFVMILICAIGMEWESKAQNFLIVIIVAAIFNFLAGAMIGPSDDLARAKGFQGMKWEVFQENLNPKEGFTMQNFFAVFAIFFPSVTGIQAGANISGDLKDPAKAIPKGTLLSLLISMISYATFVLFAGSSAYRSTSGNVTEFLDNTYRDCAPNCKYGLSNDYTIMQLMSAWPLLIYFGCWAATLSTALTNLLSVPRLIQALGIDHIYPGLIFFSKGYGKAGEPYRGYVLTFLISSAFLIIANLNLIAPLISNFYLASYALINFCTFHAALIRPLGWRPTFKYYNIWISLLGAVMCVLIMFLIDWITSLVTFFVFFVLYIVVIYRKPDANWGSSTQAQTYKTALMTVQRLVSSSEHVKNYHPQLLVLSGQPHNRPALVDLANLITKNHSLLLCAEICQDKIYYKAKIAKLQKGYNWLNLKKIKGFFNVIDGLEMEEAAISLMQISGVGKLKPNVLLMGYKSDWQKCTGKELTSYFNIMYEAFANRLAVAILRVPGGLDCAPSTEPKDDEGTLANQQVVIYDLGHSYPDLSGQKPEYLEPSVLAQSSLTIAGSKEEAKERPTIIRLDPRDEPKDLWAAKKKSQILHKFPDGQKLEKNELDRLRIFEKKYKGGRVDVWWLYDDGGLTILLPYILSTRSTFANCDMRIFALASKNHDLKTEEENMASLLHKFRINYTSLTMINEIMEEPQQRTKELFDSLISDFKNGWANGLHVSEEELANLKERTNRQLKLRELLQKHSKESTLVVMSLPMPRKAQVPPPVYMAWLEALTRDMPPFLLIRGNQAPVLTFYS